MFLLCKTSIDCAHMIEDTDELLTKKCASKHGHTYNFEIAIDRDMLAKYYNVDFVDFALLKRDIIEGILDKYDHKDITELFKVRTVEHLATLVKMQIKGLYGNPNDTALDYELDKLIRVRVFETAKWGVEV